MSRNQICKNDNAIILFIIMYKVRVHNMLGFQVKRIFKMIFAAEVMENDKMACLRGFTEFGDYKT